MSLRCTVNMLRILPALFEVLVCTVICLCAFTFRERPLLVKITG